MRFASIDIGTNTILLLIADVDSNGFLHVIRDVHSIARMGKGVDAHGLIQQETIHRVCRILSRMKAISDASEVEHLTVCGTSALRDAANRHIFIDEVKSTLAIDIRVLSGQEEAYLSYFGAISEYLNTFESKEYAVLDIGGGSTELILGRDDVTTSAFSVDIGSVRLTERILHSHPPTNSELSEATDLIRTNLKEFPLLHSKVMLLGVAGTLTTLAAINLRLPTFNRNLINKHILHIDEIQKIFEELKILTLDQLRSFPQIHPARADILLAGILILLETLKKLDRSSILVSTRGLRYGILLEKAFLTCPN